MQFRDHPGVQGKRDAYPFDPRLLKIEPGYNVRNMDSVEARAKLDELKQSIRANGVRVPLEVRLADDDVFVVAGHRRHTAVIELIAEGEPIETVLVFTEPKGTNDADRVLNLHTSNSGEPLKPLELAEIVRRLDAFGWDHGQIARRIGWKSAASVKQHLDMLAMPEAVKEQVRQGDVSATVARQIVKESARDAKDDPEFAAELIRNAKEENARIKGKGKSHKVTAKTLKRDKPKQQPKAKPDAEIKDAGTDTVHHQAPAMVAAAPEPLPPVSQERVHETKGDAERDQDIVRLAPQRSGIKEMISALAPFAKIVPDFDPECPDEHVILISDLGHEITAGQCRTAWRVWNAATGGSAGAEAA